MARKPDIQYVGQFYVYGSEARQAELKPTPKKTNTTLPKFLRREQVKIYLDPVALAGLVVAVAMTILMAVSAVQYVNAFREYEAMERTVVLLQDKNARLNHNYRTEMDLEYVESTALALGMVPAEDVQSLTIKVTVPEPEPEPTVWDDIRWFFEGLFA